MGNKILIELAGTSGASLIVPAQTGVIYSHQCGGLLCAQQSCEGFLVPLRAEALVQVGVRKHESLNDALLDYFAGPKWAGHCYSGIDAEDADYLDGLFLKYYETKHLKINRGMLKETKEAWLHVIISPEAKLRFQGITAENAILISQNSD